MIDWVEIYSFLYRDDLCTTHPKDRQVIRALKIDGRSHLKFAYISGEEVTQQGLFHAQATSTAENST